MSNNSISAIYESVMRSIREAQQETYKVIQNFVNDTNQAIQRVSEQHERTEKAIDRVSAQHEETQKSLQELSEQHKKTEKTIDRVSEQNEETKKSLQKYVEEGIKERKKLSKQMGILGNRFGEIAEHMVFPAVVKRFNELGYNFNFEFEGNCKVRNKNNQIIAEIDIYLENGTTIAIIEVKTKPDLNDIDKHIQRIEKLKQNRQEKNEPSKTLIGAIAGAIFPKEVKEAALQVGFYVLVQSGDTMKLEIPKDFKPREF
jgi:hypothetical protein